MIPEYRQLKSLLTRASKLHLLAARDVEDALRDRDSVVLQQQKAAASKHRLPSTNATSSEAISVDFSMIIQPRAAKAYVLICELDRIAQDFNKRIQPTEMRMECVLDVLVLISIQS